MACSVCFQLLLLIVVSITMVVAATAENNKNKQLFAFGMSASNTIDQWKKGESGNMYQFVASSKMFNKNMDKINSVPFYDPHVNIQLFNPLVDIQTKRPHSGDTGGPPAKRRKLEDMTDALKKTGPQPPPCAPSGQKCQIPANTNDSKLCVASSKPQSTPRLYLTSRSRPERIHASQNSLEVHALPVGQGDCTVIFCPNGINAVLFDCGSVSGGDNRFGPDDIQNYFSSIQKITIIISHGDQDHYNYLPKVFPLKSDIAKKITKVITGGPSSDCTCAKAWINEFKNDGKLFFTGSGGKSVTDLNNENNFCEDTDIKFHFIAAGSPGKKNERSIVMQLSRKDNPSTLLFPGDMEGPTAEKLAADPAIKAQLKSTHYKIAHHGASTLANKKEWLDAINPDEAHVSCVYYGSFGHPRCEVIEMLVPELGTTQTVGSLTHPFTCLTEKASSKKNPADIARYHPEICHRLYSTAPGPVATKICVINLVFLPKSTLDPKPTATTEYYCADVSEWKKNPTPIPVPVCPKSSSDDDDDIPT